MKMITVNILHFLVGALLWLIALGASDMDLYTSDGQTLKTSEQSDGYQQQPEPIWHRQSGNIWSSSDDSKESRTMLETKDEHGLPTIWLGEDHPGSNIFYKLKSAELANPQEQQHLSLYSGKFLQVPNREPRQIQHHPGSAGNLYQSYDPHKPAPWGVQVDTSISVDDRGLLGTEESKKYYVSGKRDRPLGSSSTGSHYFGNKYYDRKDDRRRPSLSSSGSRYFGDSYYNNNEDRGRPPSSLASGSNYFGGSYYNRKEHRGRPASGTSAFGDIFYNRNEHRERPAGPPAFGTRYYRNEYYDRNHNGYLENDRRKYQWYDVGNRDPNFDYRSRISNRRYHSPENYPLFRHYDRGARF